MNRLNGYWLRKKKNEELSTGARLYRNSMRPEEQLDEMYEVMQNVGLGEEFDPDDLSTLFSDFSNDEKMYPSMMKPERRKLWDQRKQQLEQIQERQKNAKRQLHAQFMVRNPELPLAKELRKTEYGQGLMAEMTTNQPRKPETGTGRTITDEQERDSANIEAIQQFETRPFTVPDMDEPFSLLATERDKNGRIIKKALALAPQPILREYEYDNNGRLSKVLCEGAVIEQYHYGKYGERLLSETRHSEQSLYKYNDMLQVIEAGDTKYYYDNQGRIIEKINLGRRTHYSYLESGPLHEVHLPDGSRIEYTCDAAGRRITKSINGKVVEKYLWQDLTTLVAVTDGEGLHPRVFNYDDEGGPVAMTYEGATFFFATDQVDSIFMVADEQGNEVKRIIYDSFGNLLFDSNEKFDTYIGFATGLTDKDTGLIHFGHREYDPTIGRFITPDPIGFAGGDVDVYGYCLDDPINFYDWTGLEGKSEENRKSKGDSAPKRRKKNKLAGANRNYEKETRSNQEKGKLKDSEEDSYPIKEVRAYHGNGTLEVYSENGPRDTYEYTSGRPGKKDPTQKDEGPLPSGEYEFAPQEASEVEGIKYILRRFTGDWGHGRVPLHPSKGTKTYGRDGFYIHGGDTKGSAGCLDIGDKDRAFFKNVRKTKKAVKVTVH